MKIIGITGSIAMGKSFVSSEIEKLGYPVFDADATNHEILAKNKEVFTKIKKNFPNSIENNQINREKLAKLVLNNEKNLKTLENITHPIINQYRDNFIKKCQKNSENMVFLNIPLLFEKGGYKICNKNILILTPRFVQKRRFLSRFKTKNPNFDQKMAKNRLKSIISHQKGDFEKKKMADFVIYNFLGKFLTVFQIKRILKKIND